VQVLIAARPTLVGATAGDAGTAAAWMAALRPEGEAV
jgi:hypothetical protein